MIFKTFNNDIDKISAKWGVFGKSFYDFVEASRNRKIAIDELYTVGGMPLKDAKKQAGSFWSYLYPKKEDIQAQLIDVDSVLPKIDENEASNVLNIIKSIEDGTYAEAKSFQELYDTGDKTNQWIAKYAQETKGQIRSTEGIIKANQVARDAAIAHNAALKQQTLGAKAASVAMKALSVVGNMLAMYAITKLITAYSDYKEKLHDIAEEMSAQAKKSSEYVDNLLDLKTQLEEGTKSSDELTSAFKNQLEAMGYTETEIDNLIAKYNGLSGAIDEATRKALENAKTDAYADVASASKALERDSDGGLFTDILIGDYKTGLEQLDSEIEKILSGVATKTAQQGKAWISKDNSAEGLYAYYNALKEVSRLIQETASETNNNELLDLGNAFDPTIYGEVTEAINKLKDSAELYGEAISRLHNADAQLELSDYLKTNDINSQETFDNYINGIKDSTEYSESYKQVLIDVANKAFPQFSQQAKNAAETLGDFGNKTDNPFAKALSASDKYKDYLEKFQVLAEQGNLSPEILSSTEEYSNILEKLGYSANDATESLKRFFGELNYGNMMEGLESSIGGVIEAQFELAQSGKLSFDTTKKLLKQYPELKDSLQAVTGGYITEDSVLQNLIETKLASYKLDMNDLVDAANKVITSQGGQAIAYGLTTDEIIKQIKAQIALLKTQGLKTKSSFVRLEDLGKDRFSSNKDSSNPLTYFKDNYYYTNQKQIDELESLLDSIDNSSTNYENALEIYNALLEEKEKQANSSSSSSTDTWKQAFDDQLATLKHQLAMNQITEAQYYSELDRLNKEYFANREEYLSEYRQYEEEVYKGLLSLQDKALDSIHNLIELREDMIKDMKQKEIDAIEKIIEAEKKKLDAIKETIDARKEAIELLKDEKNHEEEMAEKNKAISDIQVQIDRLKLDNSASAQKKRRELEEQLAEKKKDLADYIADYEYDKAIEALDKEAEAAEKQYEEEEERLQGQIDEIQKYIDDEKLLMQVAINDINGMNNSLYEDMKNWALETTGEVWKVVDAWKAAKEALELYNSVNQVPEIHKILHENSQNNIATGIPDSGLNAIGGNTDYYNTNVPPSNNQDNSPTGYKAMHTIQRGDTLWDLAVKYYGDGTQWTKIQQANGGIDPYTLQIGSQLYIPYKKGTKYVPKNTLALTDEEGEELILHANEKGTLRSLTKGSSVIPAELTEHLMEWGELTPESFAQDFKFNVPSINIPEFTFKDIAPNISIGDININGNMGNLTKSDLNEFRKGIVNDVYESMQKNRVKAGRY